MIKFFHNDHNNKSLRVFASRWLAVWALLLLCAAPMAKAEQTRPGKVQDLAYGDALFHFYSDDYFASATRLLVAQQQKRLPNHNDDAELLLGGLYLSYGRQDDAANIFSRLLDTANPKVRDRAWLYLAEIAWQRGNSNRAKQALASVGVDLEDEFIARKQLLAARLAIDEQRFDDAIRGLENWQGGKELGSYAKFNLGVAMIRHGQVDQGADFLKQVGAGDFDGLGQSRWRIPQKWRVWSAKNDPDAAAPDEQQAMRDKANLALGFAFLQKDQAQLALDILSKVSSHSALFSKAKLGAGWAASELENYPEALRHWQSLTKMDRLDPAVQEALLAIPFARMGMDQETVAVAEYQHAIEQFEAEIDHLKSFQSSLNQGEFLRALLADDNAGTVGWFWKLKHIPDTTESRYLYHLVADHSFQEGLKNYRDLVFLKNNLLTWQQNISAYEHMLVARESRFSKSLTAQQENTTASQLAQITTRVEVAKDRLKKIDATHDTVALATPDEQRSWNKIVQMELILAQATSPKTLSAAASKHRLLKGVMLWNFEQRYAERLWQQQKALRLLQQQQHKAEIFSAALSTAKTSAPQRFGDFDQRINAVTPRIERLLGEINQALGGHENYLALLAGRQIEQHKLRLVAYLTEAQFALASSYDRAAQIRETP